MYTYTDFDRAFVRARAAQFRDQLERHLSGALSDDDFRPLRLQMGWYVQRHAPMLRVAVPYGCLDARQLRALARVAREFDQPSAEVYAPALAQQLARGTPHLPTGVAHLSTRQNVQFNWIALDRAADVMDVLAEADLHGIQTSGNCIRSITSDALAGIAPDEVVDARPYCELLRQWSTLNPEFSALPRKFKIALSAAAEDRAALAWHDIGLHLRRDAQGQVGAQVRVGGGMGRTPIIAPVLADFVPWTQWPAFIQAIVRVYNLWGRRDNAYKARIKILLRAEGERFAQAVQAEFARILLADPGATFSPAELARVQAQFAPPTPTESAQTATENVAPEWTVPERRAFDRWLAHNVHAHRDPQLAAVTLSLKRPGWAPGDASADLLDAAADLADRYSRSRLRITHSQDLLLPWVRRSDLPALWRAARSLRLAQPAAGVLHDFITCPGGDLCALANARTLPLAEALLQRYQDMDELEDLGPIALHVSGCMNSCGHHHSGHIGVLGVDKDGREWYQVALGGSDGRTLGGPAQPARVIGPAFAASEVPEVIEALLETYRTLRQPGEPFIASVRRLGLAPFAAAADAARHETRHPHAHLGAQPGAQAELAEAAF